MPHTGFQIFKNTPAQRRRRRQMLAGIGFGIVTLIVVLLVLR